MLYRRPVAAGRRELRFTGLALTVALLWALLPGSVAAVTKPYVVDLGARSDFVAQTNFVQCVGASMQMMINMQRAGSDRTRATQLRLQRIARAWSGPRPDGTNRKGAGVLGWALGLNLSGAGPYGVVGLATLDEALLTAARAIKTTGRPVGLLVWRGRHAWVMSGFQATGDPMAPGTRVTGAIVEDPLYPHGSKVWGPSPRPGATLTPKQLGRQFVPRRTSGFSPSLSGKYVLVLPYQYQLRTHRAL